MTPALPHVTILLCTRNGARFLPAQLESYLAQTHRDWSLWISDDGSDDGTRALLEAFRERHGGDRTIRIVEGPRAGSAATNFLSLLCHPDLPPGHVALSDQDDIWLPGKLARGLAMLAEAGDGPRLYSAQSRYIDADGVERGGSVPPPAAPTFSSATLQNVMAGHSMLLDPGALALVRAAGVRTDIAFHDWWLTLLVTAAGGRAVLDREAVTLYRQHGHNVLGAPGGLAAGLHRAREMLGGGYGRWVTRNMRALDTAGALLEPGNARRVQRFLASPARLGPARVRLLRAVGFHRQSRVETALVLAAAFLGKL